MSSKREEVTTIVNRRIKKGHELEYANWFGRITEAIRKAPGFREGVTVPGSRRRFGFEDSSVSFR
jgi:antibiotic biosynthesis monooxygenase (ABM) superfamily enzyme